MSESTGKVPWRSNSAPGSITEYEVAVHANLFHFRWNMIYNDPTNFKVEDLLVDNNGDLITTNYGVLLQAK